jgi:peptide-methionine (R)-S-oxide reductase
MKRSHLEQFRLFAITVLLIVGWFLLPSRNVAAQKPATPSAGEAKSEDDEEQPEKIVKTEAEWKKQLTKEQFRVTRKKGTEQAFTGKYWRSKKDGVYQCICCELPLFDSQTKFDSGTGWPSFFMPLKKNAVAYHQDRSMGVVRTEVVCNRCDAHLGHVFADGPAPTGMRFCMNSASLKHVPREKDAESRDEPKSKD